LSSNSYARSKQNEGGRVATEDFARPPLFYARVAGFIYLFAMALGIFSQVFVLGRMVVPGDAAATANNILAFEGLFRLGIAVDVITFVSDVVIAWAFYELLKQRRTQRAFFPQKRTGFEFERF
jgi:hypothetical protein